MNNYEDILISINALMRGEQPCKDISELLYRHKCFYLLSKMSSDYKYVQIMQNDMMRDSIYIQESYQTCQSIFNALEFQSVKYAVIKGAVLSKAAYGGPFCRYTKDIDILINKEDIDVVKKILVNNGFLQGKMTKNGIRILTRKEILFQSTFSHQVAPFIKAIESPYYSYINIDLNTNIMWGECDEKADMRMVLDYTEDTTICGVKVKKLSSEMEFISLCLHHYKDMNSIYLLCHGSLRLKLFLDIYMYLKNGELDARSLYSLCEHLKVIQYIYYCVYYTSLIFCDKEIEKYCIDFKTPECERLIRRYGLTDSEYGEWNIEFYDRLFNPNLYEYLRNSLTMQQIRKIETNEHYM